MMVVSEGGGRGTRGKEDGGKPCLGLVSHGSGAGCTHDGSELGCIADESRHHGRDVLTRVVTHTHTHTRVET